MKMLHVALLLYQGVALKATQPVRFSAQTAPGPAVRVFEYPLTQPLQPMFKMLSGGLKPSVASSFSVVVGIMIEPGWDRLRGIHRQNWMQSQCVSKKFAPGKVTPFFVSGLDSEQLQHEKQLHDDIFILQHDDTPRNKTFAWFREAANHFPEAAIFAKMDADTFLNPCTFLSDLATLHLTDTQSLYYGFMTFKTDFKICSHEKIRELQPDLCGKLSLAVETVGGERQWQGARFPRAGLGQCYDHDERIEGGCSTVMLGPFYAVSHDIAKWIGAGGDERVHLPDTTSREVGHGEDVYFADWVARFFNVHPEAQPRIVTVPDMTSKLGAFVHVSDMLSDAEMAPLREAFPAVEN